MSSSKRPLILMVIFLGLLSAYLITSYRQQQPAVTHRPAIAAAPRALPGSNAVIKLEVKQDKAGTWTADFDYFFTGEPRMAFLFVELLLHTQDGSDSSFGGTPNLRQLAATAVRGRHHVSFAIAYPGSELTTHGVEVTMRDVQGVSAIATQHVPINIDWPNFQTWNQNQQFARNTPAGNLARAVALVDGGNDWQLNAAKVILERLISDDRRFDAAYIELARVAMKSNWGPEGLHQAENLLASALQIRPDNVNAKILLAYVYAHQKRFDRAQELFAESARSNPPNLWVWTNWGELLLMQHKADQAIAKYREAISRPVTHDTYDRARKGAYTQLLTILQERKDLKGMEALYKQRVADYGPGSCYSSDYARFLLQVRGDTQGAIDLARRALNQDCEDSEARQILGLAEYVKWASATEPERAESLNQARIYLPAGPMPLYLLAASDLTAPTIRQLMAAGESIDQKDNARQTALAYALQNGDLGAARRLLKLRARPDTSVGYEDMPLALVPVIQGNLAAIRLLREFGVDYSKLRYRGATAIDFAKQSGKLELLQALGRDEASL